MNKERDKARKILNILIEYFVLHEFSDLSAHIDINDDYTEISIEGRINSDISDIDQLKENLKHPRMVEYEEYYGGLLDMPDEKEISSIGYLVDKSDVEVKNQLLSITVIRNH